MINKQMLLDAILNGNEINVVSYIDATYGYWRETFIAHKHGYIKSIKGADNWTYCPVCGHPHSQSNLCDCDEDNMNLYEFFNKDDVFKYIIKNKNYEIEIIKI